MVELVSFFAVLVTVALVGLAAALVVFVLWLVFLPFQLMAAVFKGLGLLLALPFLLLFAVLGCFVFGAGLVLFLFPLLPFLLLAWLVWRWLGPKPGTASA